MLAKNDFQKALTQGLIKSNPTEDFKMPKKQQTVEELEKVEEYIFFLEKEELANFLKYDRQYGRKGLPTV